MLNASSIIAKAYSQHSVLFCFGPLIQNLVVARQSQVCMYNGSESGSASWNLWQKSISVLVTNVYIIQALVKSFGCLESYWSVCCWREQGLVKVAKEVWRCTDLFFSPSVFCVIYLFPLGWHRVFPGSQRHWASIQKNRRISLPFQISQSTEQCTSIMSIHTGGQRSDKTTDGTLARTHTRTNKSTRAAASPVTPGDSTQAYEREREKMIEREWLAEHSDSTIVMKHHLCT